MTSLFRRLLLTLALFLPISSTTQAQQPFYTDDADVTPRGHFHFEFSNEFDLLIADVAGGNYQFRRNVSFDFGMVVGKYAASPRTGVQLGISVDW